MKIKLRTELRDLAADVPPVDLRPQPWITIVLPTKDRAEGAAAFLQSLPEAADPARTEVILYAPREDPDLVALLARFGASRTVADGEVFSGGATFCWSTLMNHAFRRARGDWVMYASDDIVMRPDAIRIALSQPAAADPAVGGISFLHRNTEETYGGFFARYGYDTLLGERPFINFGLVRRTAFEQTSGFDERYRFYWADVDLCMQLQDAGYRIEPSPASLVEHVNTQDALRTGNADTVFDEDTAAFAEKWRRHPFFRRRNPLHKVRFQVPLPEDAAGVAPPGPIVIDGVIFQLQPHGGGISRLWREQLERIARSPLAPHLLLLDRDGTCPPFPGLKTHRVGRFEGGTPRRRARDARRMQRVCDRYGAALYVSTYYTRAKRTPTVVTVYDFVPEVLGWDLDEPQWQAKQEAVSNAAALVVISESTYADLMRIQPPGSRPVRVVSPAAGAAFRPRSPDAVAAFRTAYGIDRPYFLVVGHRWPHKNVGLFLRAFACLEARSDVDVLFTGGAPELEPEWRPYVADSRAHLLRLDDDELACAYSGALGLVYPSRYEGFGMPVLEAMACACPVVTCRNSSLQEVAGESARYVGEDDDDGMRAALEELLDPERREALAAAGPPRAARYSWEDSASAMEAFLRELAGAAVHSRDNVAQ